MTVSEVPVGLQGSFLNVSIALRSRRFWRYASFLCPYRVRLKRVPFSLLMSTGCRCHPNLEPGRCRHANAGTQGWIKGLGT